MQIKCCKECVHYHYEDAGMNDVFSYCKLLNKNENTGKYPTIESEIFSSDASRAISPKCPLIKNLYCSQFIWTK